MATEEKPIETKRQMVMKLQRQLIETNQLPTCTNCEHFRQLDETCGLFGDKRPPLKWVVTGCEQWEAGIPF